jgi:RNA-directed DNA polymerase
LWLTTPVVERDEQGRKTVTRPTQGTPQGGVISPLLANIYLHWFEKAFHRPGWTGAMGESEAGAVRG